MPAQPPDFALTLDVRDYECDLQGIVNNAIYQHYLEHARHQYLQSLGLSFARFHEQGHDLVLTRAEIDYKTPLRSGDRFTVELRVETGESPALLLRPRYLQRSRRRTRAARPPHRHQPQPRRAARFSA